MYDHMNHNLLCHDVRFEISSINCLISKRKDNIHLILTVQ